MRTKEETEQLVALINILADTHGMVVEKDNYGQFVIYTGLMEDKNGNTVDWTDNAN